MVENQPSYNPNEELKVFNFVDTTSTRKIFTLKKRIRAVAGGTSASKTISILIWCIDYCQSPRNKSKTVSVISESYPHLQRGAMLDFELIMKDRGYWDDNCWNQTKHTYYFGSNKLEFYSVDTYGKARGPRRDVLFVNECNNMPYNIVDQLIVRTREIVWLDWNPTNEFWFYTEMLPIRDDIDFITLTYLDNEALDQVTIREIESHKHNKTWWQVYGLGQLGDVESRIFTGWNTSLEEIPVEARLERYGLDFGYSNDPTAIVAIYKWNDSYIFDEICYMKGLANNEIATILSSVEKKLVVADSAEPKSIDELKKLQVKILPATKGSGSVLQGIQNVQQQKIFVTRRSVNIIKEYRNYLWLTDKDGTIINEPQDFLNHTMDAIRYGLDSFVKKGNFTHDSNVGGLKSLPGGIG